MAIQIDYSLMEAEASNLRAEAENFEIALNNLMGRIATLTSPEGGFYTEVSSGAFGDSYQEFNSRALNLIPALNDFQADLTNAIERFKSADGA